MTMKNPIKVNINRLVVFLPMLFFTSEVNSIRDLQKIEVEHTSQVEPKIDSPQCAKVDRIGQKSEDNVGGGREDQLVTYKFRITYSVSCQGAVILTSNYITRQDRNIVTTVTTVNLPEGTVHRLDSSGG